MKQKVLLWCLAALSFVIFLILMTLKLTGAVVLSWWLITLPLWGPITLLLLACLLIFCYLGWWRYRHPDEFTSIH
ncbi:MAG: hypothetical protein HUK14_06110 [Muribaculaceae bacterium]|nr:hypothetical protein [Muribaculaceae bacterium]